MGESCCWTDPSLSTFAIPTHSQWSLVEITRSWSVLSGILHGPCSERSALEKNHTWWELWNNAASGMFPRWPVGSDGGPCGCFEGFMGNLTHTYRVTWSNVSCVSLHLDLLLFVLDLNTPSSVPWFHLTAKEISEFNCQTSLLAQLAYSWSA